MKTLEKLKELLEDYTGVDGADIQMDSHFVQDLGLDSLDEVELLMAIEEEFGIEISDERAQECLTVEKMVALIDSLRPEGKAAESA
jgi:acyl carrier protein